MERRRTIPVFNRPDLVAYLVKKGFHIKRISQAYKANYLIFHFDASAEEILRKLNYIK